MGPLVFAVLLGFGGILGAVFYTFIVGFAGAPGTMLSAAAAKRSPDDITPVWGLFLTVAGQLYTSLVFVTLVIYIVEPRLIETTGLGKWLVWVVAFLVAIAPPVIAVRDAVRAERRNVQHYAIILTTPLTAIGFFLFRLVPAVMNAGWGWVPQF